MIFIHGFINRDDSFSVENAVCQLESTPTTRIRLGIMFNAFCTVHVHMQGKFYSGLSEKCEVLSLYALCRKLHIGHFHAIPLHCICYNIADTMQIGRKFQNCTVGCWRETFKGFHGNFNLHTKLGCYNRFHGSLLYISTSISGSMETLVFNSMENGSEEVNINEK